MSRERASKESTGIHKPRPADDAGPLLISTAKAFETLGIRHTKGWELIREGVLETVKIGKRRLVKMQSVRRIAEEGAQ